jgi:hypothetical protein
MNRIVRAAGFAAAAIALGATATFSAPSMAGETLAQTAVSAPLDTASAAGLEAALDGVAAQVAPRPKAEDKPGVLSRLWTAATDWAGLAAPRPPEAGARRSLDELVQAYAGEQTEGSEQDCLAKAIYFEARGEPIEGQLAVAQVVMNRAASGRYPTTLCEVITQRAQFSFISKGRFPTPQFGSEAWRKAVAIARIAQARLADAVPSGVLWYHADYVAPSWGKRLTRNTKIGLHIFYS